MNQEEGSHQTECANALILDFPTSRTVRNKCLNHPVYGNFVIAAQMDEDTLLP